ncbi:LOW QUALITY PROTEIN: plasma membrane iron permease [Purpureocillium lavendulum]|uniref:Plasma membrane iron permease n=1 Tax=Purpureocillium lavendulum TaxID=1247861 RepID=A0AB34FV26_9HYPO|nr:LOW QUALITY PROTEIN: plasma membrane iron permease [Purpureocillium lavendulum]
MPRPGVAWHRPYLLLHTASTSPAMAKDVFSVPIFLIVFRETLETVIIVSVLLAFLKQTLDGPNRDVKVYKKLRRQVWIGVGAGFLICMIIAAALIGVFYTVGSNSWESNEHYYEGAFCLLASVIITAMGVALLRVGKMQEKWRVKLARSLEAPLKTASRRKCFSRFLEKYAMFALPFITVLREGIEAVVFVAGVSFSAPAYAVPLPVVVGLLVGGIIGWLLFKGGSTMKLQIFLVASTCLLYLVSAGLFSRAVWHFEIQEWNKAVGGDAAETGNAAGSYDIDKSVWHVNPDGANDGGWGVFNAILGWTNSATYGSVISYNVYWIFVIAMFVTMRYKEVKGHWPLMKAKAASRADVESHSGSESREGTAAESKGAVQEKTTTAIPHICREESESHAVGVHHAVITQPLVVGDGSRKCKGPLAVLTVGEVLVPAQLPGDVGAPLLPVGVRDGDHAGGEHGAYVVEDGLDSQLRAAVDVMLVDLVVGALLERRDELLDVEVRRVRHRVERRLRVVDEEEQLLGLEEPVQLAQLEDVARGARVPSLHCRSRDEYMSRKWRCTDEMVLRMHSRLNWSSSTKMRHVISDERGYGSATEPTALLTFQAVWQVPPGGAHVRVRPRDEDLLPQDLLDLRRAACVVKEGPVARDGPLELELVVERAGHDGDAVEAVGDDGHGQGVRHEGPGVARRPAVHDAQHVLEGELAARRLAGLVVVGHGDDGQVVDACRGGLDTREGELGVRVGDEARLAELVVRQERECRLSDCTLTLYATTLSLAAGLAVGAPAGGRAVVLGLPLMPAAGVRFFFSVADDVSNVTSRTMSPSLATLTTPESSLLAGSEASPSAAADGVADMDWRRRTEWR